MKICKEFKFLNKENLIDIVVISILRTLLHFAYEFSGGNILVAIFSSVNESIWEHIKIAIVPTYLVALFKMGIQMKRKNNLWTALFAKVITLIIVIPILFYAYTSIFKIESLVIDIVIFYVAIIISQIVETIVEKKTKISSKEEDVYKYLNLFIILAIVTFTFYPPKLELFKDKIVNKI